MGPFVHRIDPVLGQLGGFYLWFYGLSYTLGFLELYLWFRISRRRLGLTLGEVYNLCIIFSSCVLLGGRIVEVIFYEWAYYRDHLVHIPWFWLGGMSTHGLLVGAAVGTFLFCRIHRKEFLRIADELVIPGAFLMGVGRIGNFIDGQIIGSVTDVWWAVQFPDAPGFRHPVVLYDGVKNLLLILLLIAIRNRRPPRGVVMGHFFFWYAFLRLFVDLFREYPTRLFGIPTGQTLNIGMALFGLALIVVFKRRGAVEPVEATVPPERDSPAKLWIKRLAFLFILLFCLTIPSDWTQDIPERYGKRHPGLRHSKLYPPIR